jgi:hypothetical protein
MPREDDNDDEWCPSPNIRQFPLGRQDSPRRPAVTLHTVKTAPSIDTIAGDGSFPHVNSGGALRLEPAAVVTFEPTVRAACYNRRNFSAMSAAHAGRIPGASSSRPRAALRPAVAAADGRPDSRAQPGQTASCPRAGLSCRSCLSSRIDIHDLVGKADVSAAALQSPHRCGRCESEIGRDRWSHYSTSHGAMSFRLGSLARPLSRRLDWSTALYCSASCRAGHDNGARRVSSGGRLEDWHCVFWPALGLRYRCIAAWTSSRLQFPRHR